MLKEEKLKKFLKKNNKKKIVLCHGVFDVLHIGHLNYLKKAKSLGEVLIVSITSKKFVNKGFDRPLFNDYERKKFLENISFVDYVYINDNFSSKTLIKKIKPNFYCKGKEYSNPKNDLTNNIEREINEVKKFGGKFKIINTKTYSSSKIINNQFKNYDLDQRKVLSKVKKELTEKKIFEIKKKNKNRSVTLIAEAIINSKKNRLRFSEKCLKDILSVANILAAFMKKVTIVTYFDKKKNQLKYLRNNTLKNVKFEFINKRNVSTIYKKSYFDYFPKSKILSSHKINENYFNFVEENKILKILNNMKKNEFLCVMYHSGELFSQRICDKLNKLKNKKGLNFKFNPLNSNFQKILKFKNFDIVCFNPKRIQSGQKQGFNLKSIELRSKNLQNNQKFNKVILALDKDGSKLRDRYKNKIYHCPAFTEKTNKKNNLESSLFAIAIILNDLPLSNNSILFLGSYLTFLNLKNNSPVHKININDFFKHVQHYIK